MTADGFAKKLIEETVAYVPSFISAVATSDAESARSAGRNERFRRGGGGGSREAFAENR